MRIIADKHGEQYQVTDSQFGFGFDLRIMTLNSRFRSAEVGYAYCSVKSTDILELTDVVIKDSRTLWRKPVGLFRVFKGPVPELHCFRGRGLGTELLRIVFAMAKERGHTQITGRITSEDFKKNPRLPVWYSRMGFSIISEYSTSANYAQIQRQL